MCTLIICLGNPLRGDDAFGLIVFRLLRKLGLPAVYFGTSLENALPLLRKVEWGRVIVVDTFLGEYSDLVVFPLSDERCPKLLTTHNLPVKMLLWTAGFDSNRVIVVGARAENLDVGSKPSVRIRRLAVEAASLIVKIMMNLPLPEELKLGNEGSFVTRNIDNFAMGH